MAKSVQLSLYLGTEVIVKTLRANCYLYLREELEKTLYVTGMSQVRDIRLNLDPPIYLQVVGYLCIMKNKQYAAYLTPLLCSPASL